MYSWVFMKEILRCKCCPTTRQSTDYSLSALTQSKHMCSYLLCLGISSSSGKFYKKRLCRSCKRTQKRNMFPYQRHYPICTPALLKIIFSPVAKKVQSLTSGLAVGLVKQASSYEFCNKKKAKAYLYCLCSNFSYATGKKKRKSKGNCLEPLEKNQGMTGK